MWGLVAFLALPLVEIGLLVEAGRWIGLWPTLGLVLLSTLAGLMVIRTQGMLTMERMRASLGDPAQPMARGAMGYLAGLLLVVPGLLTSAIGLLLLLPPVQDLVLGRIAARVVVRTSGPRGRRAEPEIIEGEFREIDPDSQGLPGVGLDADEGPGPRRPSGWTKH